ncbi:MAG: lysophospholipase [Gammaproteobacteria bacterium]
MLARCFGSFFFAAAASFAALALTACRTPARLPVLAQATQPMLKPTHAVMSDGTLLPSQSWVPPGPVAAVVLALHGFNEYSHSFTAVGPYLALRGILTYAYDQRGFGATAHPGIWAGNERLVADVRELTRLLRRRYPGVPVYLLGESMGGAVAMAALTRPHSPKVDGVVLVSPAVWGRRLWNPFVRATLWVMANTFPGLTVTGRGLNRRPSDNDAMRANLSRDPLVIKATRFDAIAGLSDAMDEALAAVPRLRHPSLILYGAHDQIIPRSCFELFAEAQAAAPDWRLAWYPQGYHMLTRDLHASVVLQDIASWILNRASALPSGYEWVPSKASRPMLTGAND